jgi:hypothetical protein
MTSGKASEIEEGEALPPPCIVRRELGLFTMQRAFPTVLLDVVSSTSLPITTLVMAATIRAWVALRAGAGLECRSRGGRLLLRLPWQRPRQQRQRCGVIPGADQARRAGHYHQSGNHSILHHHSRGDLAPFAGRNRS